MARARIEGEKARCGPRTRLVRGIYYPTALRRAQLTPKTCTNITRYSFTPEDRLDRFSVVDQSIRWMQVRICVFCARSSLDLHHMPMVTVILLDSEPKGYVTYTLCRTIRQISLGAA